MSPPPLITGAACVADRATQAAERAIDHQVAAISDEFQRLDMLVRMAMAMVAGMLAVVGLVLRAGQGLSIFTAATFGAGFVFTVTGIIGLFIATIVRGGNAGLRQGLGATRLNQWVAEHGGVEVELMAMRLDSMSNAYEHNRALLAALVRARAGAGMWIGLGLFAHLMSIAYIARGLLHA